MMGAFRILATAAVSLWAGQACAQAQASAEARGSVTIIDPRALAQQAELSVGPVMRPGAAGLTAQAVDGRYEISGVAGDSFNIAMPSSLKLVRSGGTEEVVLQLSPSGAMTILPGAYGARATGSVAVQGAVGVPQAAAPGTYKGSFPVILSLQ
ncbi:DUF4402 domain-containing protein [Phenylobacterium sp.]|uniref:DUF4402 domain-containing protein n=1 Tax=Phenylobacterium sp. TaxID=1871053 RepID=UPI00281235ED|nr:DUF4402 domain-containing protein [Phenylobacterium sp.]